MFGLRAVSQRSFVTFPIYLDDKKSIIRMVNSDKGINGNGMVRKKKISNNKIPGLLFLCNKQIHKNNILQDKHYSNM